LFKSVRSKQLAGNFLKYDGPLTENDLPVDANELIAMCARGPYSLGQGQSMKMVGLIPKGCFLPLSEPGQFIVF